MGGWLFAQTPAGDLMTTTGIVQIIIQAGALGLLAVIVFQVPVVIKELKSWRIESDKSHKDERDSWAKEREALALASKSNFNHVVELGSQNMRVTHVALDTLSKAIDRVGEAVSKHDKLAHRYIDDIASNHPK